MELPVLLPEGDFQEVAKAGEGGGVFHTSLGSVDVKGPAWREGRGGSVAANVPGFFQQQEVQGWVA
jgi:hypothetical protein